MKKAAVLGLTGVLFFVVFSCSSSGGASSSDPYFMFGDLGPTMAGSQQQTEAARSGQQSPSQSAPVQTPPPVAVQAPPPPPRSPYYDGDGGQGKSLAILVPTGNGLSSEQVAYLPTLVQGVLVGDMTKYSSIKVLDRMNLEKVLKETESGIYKNEEDFIKLGEIVNVGYAMTGNITKTTSGYALQVQVTDTKNGETKTSYSGACTVAELDNFTGIKKASIELLKGMEIKITDRAEQELSSAGTQQAINAQTALAQGISSQRSGTVVEALSRYIQATNYDPSLAEAASRLNILSANVSSGNIGSDARNDIQWRRQWVDRLKEAEEYFKNYIKDPPPYYLVYSPNIEQVGTPDYKNETVALKFRISLIPEVSYNNTINRVMWTIKDGLVSTGRAEIWELKSWPSERCSVTTPNPFIYSLKKDLSVVVEILNSNGQSIGRQTVSLRYGYDTSYVVNNTEFRRAVVMEPLLDLFEDAQFPAVNANLITDRLTIKISSIDGISAENASKQKRLSILTESDYNNISSIKATGMDITNLSRFKFYKESLAIGNIISPVPSRFIIPPLFSDVPQLTGGGGIYGDRAFIGFFDNTREIIFSEGIIVEDAIHYSYFPNLTRIEFPESICYIDTFQYIKRFPFSLKLPANVQKIGQESLRTFYIRNGKKAGIYTFGSGNWSYSPE